MDPISPPLLALSPLWLVAGGVVLSYLCLGGMVLRPRWVVDHAWLVLGAFAAVSLAAAAVQLEVESLDPTSWRTRVRLDASEEPLMLRGDPALADYAQAVRTFGNDDTFVIAMLTSGDVFTHDDLAALRRISDGVVRLPGVRRVESLVDALSYRFSRERDRVEVEKFIAKVPSDSAALADLRRRALADPIYPKLIVSRDGAAAALNVSFHPISDRDFVDRGLDHAIREIAERESGPGREFRFAGRPHVKSQTTEIMSHDLLRLIPLAVLVAALVVWLTTGSLRGVLLPLVTCLVSVLWTFGVLAATGTAINLLTIVLAPILISLGGLYGVHIVARWEIEREHASDSREAAFATLQDVFTPELLSGITTSVGFAALIPGGIPGIEQLGMFAFFGTSMLTLISLAGIPAALAVLPHTTGERAATRFGVAVGRRLDDALVWTADRCCRHASGMLASWAVVSAVALAAVFWIVVDTDYLTFFDRRSEVRRDFAEVTERLGGPVPLYVELLGREEGAFREPANLRFVERLQAELESLPGVSAAVSMVDPLRLLNRALERDDPAEERIPDSREAVSDIVFLVPKHEMRRFASSNHSQANVLVRTGELGSRAIRTLVARIHETVERLGLPEGLELVVTGNAVALNRSADALAGNQLSGILTATATIFALVYWVFRSARVAALVMIPNVTPVLLFFGLLGAGLAPLSLPTSMIGCVALGIAVDDTVHLLVTYRRMRDGGVESLDAVRRTVRQVGRPMVISALMLMAGFLTITVSGFATIREFGWLSALTMAVCLAADMLMLPALLARARV